MPRDRLKENPFLYVDNCLKDNQKAFEILGQPIIYADPQYHERFKDYKCIDKVEHKENIFEKGSHKFWETNLSLDFFYCLKQTKELFPEATHLILLEDDTIINQPEQILNFPPKVEVEAFGLGTTCVIWEASSLEKNIQRILDLNIFDNPLPLDWAVDRIGCIRKRMLTSHKGHLSSNGVHKRITF
jgi:hypothetical protein